MIIIIWCPFANDLISCPMRHATSPTGTWLQSQPSMAYTGKPVGWKIDRVCGTVCASPVSQNPVEGIMVRR